MEDQTVATKQYNVYSLYHIDGAVCDCRIIFGIIYV